MATIRERTTKKGISFEVSIRIKGHDSMHKTFNNRADAETWAELTESELLGTSFTNFDERKTTKVGQALQRYLVEVTPHKKGAKREANRIKKWLLDPFSQRNLWGIKQNDIEELQKSLLKLGLSENSIRLEIALFSIVFETARKEWGLDDLANPCRVIKLTPSTKIRDRRISQLELDYLTQGLRLHCKNEDIISLVQFAVVSALSQSSILKLESHDIDFQKKLLQVEGRTVPLSSKALEILKHQVSKNSNGKAFDVSQDALIRAIPQGCNKGRQLYLEAYSSVPDEFLHDVTFKDLRFEAIYRLFDLGTLSVSDVAFITGLNPNYLLAKFPRSQADNLAYKLG